ncbi:VOC family protein [Parerythrobacter jejuensis]|uniref:VOC family protein n=1 Tax=Parerythrobacter jejuensis TaxID=795812 RepID=A0A845ASD7_9SPHN|nr:VOC family protein [Parerythrobacter jejuensis]MXP31875.1 VOC family protein [Parerythrobacter jejuensis]
MPKGYLEHANISVTEPERLANLLKDMLGWVERWRGPSQKYGRTIHIGSTVENGADYLAIYTGDHVKGGYTKGLPLNHLAFVVDDLEAAEAVVKAAGLEPFGHDDYDPGRRFYFFDWDGIEFEMVTYE